MRRLPLDDTAARVANAQGADAEQLATRAMDGLRRIVHALRAGTSASERAVGLSGAQLFVLRQLRAASEQSLGDLARRTRTTQSSVSEVVARLVQRGLVARESSAHDRRRAVLTLTPAGATLLESAPETVQDRLVRGFAHLDPVSQQMLARTLEAWLAAADLAESPPTFFFEPNDSPAGDSTS
jgi:DNA-binding MarR family transcriptional regulator